MTEAAYCFERAWREEPNNAEARAWLGQALCSIGKRAEGGEHLVESCRSFLVKARESKSLTQALEIAGQLQHWGEYSRAMDLLREAVEINPQDFSAHQMLAVTYAQLNKRKEALLAGGKALAIAPDNQMMQVFLGSLEADAGQYVSARARFERVLSGQPNRREAFRAHKELARVLDKLGEFTKVFPHLHAAGTLSRSLPEYTRQDSRLIPEIVKGNRLEFNRGLMGRCAGTEFPSDSPSPAFVMGFMRSGTTLTQEVLDAHPGIFVADETDLIPSMRRELHAIEANGASTAQKLARLDLNGILHLRKHYWQSVSNRFGDRIHGRYFIDKLTMNTIDLGLINMVFPDSKVIFVMRDPRDVCLSCFMQLMVPTPTAVHILTWDETARFYALVMDWWAYIRKELTLSYLELRYEDIVSDFEGTYRRVFGFLGLPWDSAVIDFHKHAEGKAVVTPSRTQVTQPLYATSVGRWRQYESEFGSVADSIDRFVEAFGYRQYGGRVS